MKKTVNIGYIGLGRRGMAMFKNCFSEMGDVNISWICDVNEERMNEAVEMLKEKGRPAPKLTRDYRDMLADKDVDAVIVMTGWNMHVKCAIDSLRAGKYTAIEVGCAYDISECYELLQAYESTHAPLMMLENACYGRREMMAIRMVREGLFGEIVHCEGGYQHYLNDVELFKKNEDGSIDTAHYRLAEYAHRNAEQYPTHEFGPLSKLLRINRGNRILKLSSFASKARGIKAYMEANVPKDHPFTGVDFKQGDIVTTVITCAGGETVVLTLDTTLPRFEYSRHFTVRGTEGMCEESAADVCTFHVEGITKEGVFNNEKEMFEKYDHPLHKEYVKLGGRGGHGGLDWLVSRAFIESVKNGTDTPIDVYDTLTWLAIGPLSEQSIALGGAPVSMPDFTCGKWLNREPVVNSKYCLDEVIEDSETSIF